VSSMFPLKAQGRENFGGHTTGQGLVRAISPPCATAFDHRSDPFPQSPENPAQRRSPFAMAMP